jgi:hypothetical protein
MGAAQRSARRALLRLLRERAREDASGTRRLSSFLS